MYETYDVLVPKEMFMTSESVKGEEKFSHSNICTS